MRKEVLFFVFIVLSALVFLTLAENVEASIYTDGVLAIYNIGDNLEYKTSVVEKTSGQHIFKSTLNCQGLENTYFATPINLEADKVFSIEIPKLKLSKNLAGDCFLRISVQNNNLEIVEEIKTNVFKLTPEIKANLKFSNEILPGTFLDITGDIFYANGKLFNGKGKISFLDSSQELEIKEGKFTTKFLIQDKTKGQNYTIIFTASDDVGNTANVQSTISVIQYPTSLVININNQTFLPLSKLIANSRVLDQVGDEVKNVEVSLELFDATDGKENKKNADGKNSVEYTFERFANPGKWIILAKYLTLAANKEIRVLELENLDTKVTGNSIILHNLGNIDFSKIVIIQLSNQTFAINISKEVALKPNETRELEVSAPKGNYSVNVDNKTFSNVPLTGGTINIKEKGTDFSKYSFVLLLFVIILLSVLIIQNIKKSKSRHSQWTRKRGIHYKKEESGERSGVNKENNLESQK